MGEYPSVLSLVCLPYNRSASHRRRGTGRLGPQLGVRVTRDQVTQRGALSGTSTERRRRNSREALPVVAPSERQRSVTSICPRRIRYRLLVLSPRRHDPENVSIPAETGNFHARGSPQFRVSGWHISVTRVYYALVIYAEIMRMVEAKRMKLI